MLNVIDGNQRQARRRAVFGGAKIETCGLTYDCFVLDVSDGGARVRMGAPLPLPHQVALRLPNGETHQATLQWARGIEAGFAFEVAAASWTAGGIGL